MALLVIAAAAYFLTRPKQAGGLSETTRATGRPLTREQQSVDFVHADLAFDVRPDSKSLKGRSKLQFQVRQPIVLFPQLGGQAVHIEYELTWEMEHAEADKTAEGYWELESIRDLPHLLEKL